MLTCNARRAHRATRLLAGLSAALTAGWGIAVTVMTGSPDLLASGADPLILTVEIVVFVVFVGAVLVSGWNLWLTFADDQRWNRKLRDPSCCCRR